MKTKRSWGVDVGESSLKAICLSLDGDKIQFEDFEYNAYGDMREPEHEGIPGRWLLPSQPSPLREFAKCDVVKKLERRLKGASVFVGVSGADSLIRQLRLPPVAKTYLPKIVEYEAKQQIPFDLRDIQWDWQKITGDEEDEFILGSEVILQVVKKSISNAILRPFAGIKVGLQTIPVAIHNVWAMRGQTSWIAILMMGARGGELVLTNGKHFWAKNISIGGNHYTHQIASEFRITHAKAEDFKIKGLEDDEFLSNVDLAGVVEPLTADLIQEINRSIAYFRSSHNAPPLDVPLILLGGPARFSLLRGAMLDIQLQQWDFFADRNVEVPPEVADNQYLFVPAYGLALQGLGLTSINMNLAPKRKAFFKWPDFGGLKRFIPRIKIEFPYAKL